MDLYFANEAALVEYLKKNLVLNVDSEHGYYGDFSFYANVSLNGTEIASDSGYSNVSNHCIGCRCDD